MDGGNDAAGRAQVGPVPGADALGRGRKLPARRDPPLLRRRGGDARRLRALRRLRDAAASDAQVARGDDAGRAQGAVRGRAHPSPVRPAGGGPPAARDGATRGSTRSGLDRTPTFGALRERSEAWLMRLLRRCVTAGWVDFTPGERPVVAADRSRARRDEGGAAGAPAAAVRRGRRGAPRADRATGRASRAVACGRGLARAATPALFEALRSHRLDVARREGVPPYVVASDRTLRELAVLAPRTRAELLRCTASGREGGPLRRRLLQVVRARAHARLTLVSEREPRDRPVVTQRHAARQLLSRDGCGAALRPALVQCLLVSCFPARSSPRARRRGRIVWSSRNSVPSASWPRR